MTDLKSDLIDYFKKTNSFKHDPVKKFRLSSGIESEFYVDCKTLMADPIARAKVAELAFNMTKDLQFDCIGGLEIGAIAIATVISDYAWRVTLRECPTFVVRKQVKGHGLGKKVEGITNKHALIVDDVLTSGGSIIQAVEAAREHGLTVDHALVIVDRQEQDGRKNLENKGLKVHSLLTIKDFQSIQKLVTALR